MEKRPFYLAKRKLPSGAVIWNYYTYDEFGNRTVPKSTGCKKKSDAINYCINLLKTNNLGNNKTKFKTYAYGFFEDNSPWYKNKMLSGGLSKNTLLSYRSSFNNHIYPYFGEMFIDKITTNIIRDFRIYLAEEKELSNKTINNIIETLRLIFNWAIEDNLIIKNPVSIAIKPLETNSEREAFTLDEIKYLLSKPWEDRQTWLYVLTGALTGMRFSEVNGLQLHQIKEGYIDICQQYTNGEVTGVKSKDARFITVPDRLRNMLIENGKNTDFIFSAAGDFTRPVPRTTIVKEMYAHYSMNMYKQKDERLLTFHALRYFLNTYLLFNEVRSEKVNFVIGHSDGKGVMQKLYTTWRPEMYQDVLECQNKLLDLLGL